MFIGYLIGGLLCLGVFLVIAGVRSGGERPQSFLAPWILIGFLVCLVVIVPRCAWQQEPEWNPIIGSEMDVFGTWKNRTETLVLAPDHTFSYRAPAKDARGTWKLEDWNLSLSEEHGYSLMRVVQAGGHYRILTHPLGDPDTWDGDLGLERVQP